MSKEVIEKVKAIQNGEEVFNELFIDCYYDIYKMAFKLCRNDADANDIVQDTFLELTRSIYNLRNPDYFYLWLNRIVTSKCIKLFRKEKYFTMEDEQLRNLPEQKETKVYNMPKENVENKEDQKVMRELVEKLPEHYAIVIQLVYFEQFTMEEIQEFLDIPMGTVKSRLHTAKKKLKVMIENYEKEEGRKIHFYDLGTLSVVSLFSWGAIKQMMKERIATATIQQAVTYTIITVSCTSTAILSVEAGKTIIEEKKQAAQIQETTQLVNTEISKQEKTKEELPVSDFLIEYNGKEITSEKDAYFIFIDWAKDPSIMNEKEEKELQNILPLYQALQNENGIYWNLLQSQGFNL